MPEWFDFGAISLSAVVLWAFTTALCDSALEDTRMRSYIRLSNRPMKDVIVSAEDFDAVSAFSWYVKDSQRCDYPCASVRNGTKVKTLRLHRFIAMRMGLLTPENIAYEVHHLDGDRYNCARDNLTILTKEDHTRVTLCGVQVDDIPI